MPKSICLAPGHGGFDSGATGNGLKEKDINLAVCLDLQKILEAAGVTVVMTRTTDEAAGGATTVQEDLTNQCKIANDAKVDLFFSIHVNAGGGHGAEAYCNPANQSAVNLSHDCVEAIAPIIGVHGEPVKDGMGLWVIHHTNMPAILLEIGYIDSSDAQILKDKLHEFAPAIAKPLIAYLGGHMPSQMPEPTASKTVTAPAQPAPVVANYVTKQELDSAVAELKKEIPQVPSLSDYVTKEELKAAIPAPVSLTDYVTKDDLNAAIEQLKAAIPQGVSDAVTKEELQQALQQLHDQTIQDVFAKFKAEL